MPNKTNYTIVVVPKVETKQSPDHIKRADPPPYNPETDKVAFDNAWQRVAKLKAEGLLPPVPSRNSKLEEKTLA